MLSTSTSRCRQAASARKGFVMSRLLLPLRHQLSRFWRIDAALTATGLLMFGLLGAFSAGLLLDPRLVLGAPLWLKPAKFALSIGLYCLTMVWLFGFIP